MHLLDNEITASIPIIFLAEKIQYNEKTQQKRIHSINESIQKLSVDIKRAIQAFSDTQATLVELQRDSILQVQEIEVIQAAIKALEEDSFQAGMLQKSIVHQRGETSLARSFCKPAKSFLSTSRFLVPPARGSISSAMWIQTLRWTRPRRATS